MKTEAEVRRLLQAFLWHDQRTCNCDETLVKWPHSMDCQRERYADRNVIEVLNWILGEEDKLHPSSDAYMHSIIRDREAHWPEAIC
jgi:hypothetical protein